MTAVSIANNSCCADIQDCFRGKLRLDYRARYLSVSQAYQCLQQYLTVWWRLESAAGNGVCLRR